MRSSPDAASTLRISESSRSCACALLGQDLVRDKTARLILALAKGREPSPSTAISILEGAQGLGSPGAANGAFSKCSRTACTVLFRGRALDGLDDSSSRCSTV